MFIPKKVKSTKTIRSAIGSNTLCLLTKIKISEFSGTFNKSRHFLITIKLSYNFKNFNKTLSNTGISIRKWKCLHEEARRRSFKKLCQTTNSHVKRLGEAFCGWRRGYSREVIVLKSSTILLMFSVLASWIRRRLKLY